MSKPPLLWLMGSFGVGKSSIIEQPGQQLNPFFYQTEAGWSVFGDKAGADSLSKFSKIDAYRHLNESDQPLILTGVFYSSQVDLPVLKQSHDVHAVFLLTSKANNRKRIQARGGTFVEKTWAGNVTKFNNLYAHFVNTIPCLIIDNNQPLTETRRAFWSYANSLWTYSK